MAGLLTAAAHMGWASRALLALALAGGGLLCGFQVGLRCVDWYRVSSFEGKAGYFAVLLALAGALVGLAIGGIVPALVGQRGFLVALGAALGVLLLATGLALALARGFADVPPRLDGRDLELELELRLPAGATLPEAASLELLSVVSRRARARRSGELELGAARQEQGRWIVPGRVPLFTSRGERALSLQLDQKDGLGFLVPLPARPGRRALEWSGWLPHAPWPDDKASYRFRVVPERDQG